MEVNEETTEVKARREDKTKAEALAIVEVRGIGSALLCVPLGSCPSCC